jgi:ATP-dependent RNA circularization protein (DNA/RNA ligase family)
MKNEKELLQDKRDLLKRQHERLQRNFKLMVKDSEEADQMLDWLNEIKRKIQRIEKQLKGL